MRSGADRGAAHGLFDVLLCICTGLAWLVSEDPRSKPSIYPTRDHLSKRQPPRLQPSHPGSSVSSPSLPPPLLAQRVVLDLSQVRFDPESVVDPPAIFGFPLSFSAVYIPLEEPPLPVLPLTKQSLTVHSNTYYAHLHRISTDYLALGASLGHHVGLPAATPSAQARRFVLFVRLLRSFQQSPSTQLRPESTAVWRRQPLRRRSP